MKLKNTIVKLWVLLPVAELPREYSLEDARKLLHRVAVDCIKQNEKSSVIASSIEDCPSYPLLKN